LNAAKEKLEIVSGSAHFDFAQYKPPPFRIFAGGIPRRLRRRNAFGLIQVFCTNIKLSDFCPTDNVRAELYNPTVYKVCITTGEVCLDVIKNRLLKPIFGWAQG